MLVLMIFSLTFLPTLLYSLQVAFTGNDRYLTLEALSDSHTPGVIAGDILKFACKTYLAAYAVFCALFARMLKTRGRGGSFKKNTQNKNQ